MKLEDSIATNRVARMGKVPNTEVFQRYSSIQIPFFQASYFKREKEERGGGGGGGGREVPNTHPVRIMMLIQCFTLTNIGALILYTS